MNLIAHTPNVELIHDVDDSLDNSKIFSSIERATGNRSTFFVRLHAKWYNALSYKNIEIMKQLIDSGSSVGLHFEPAFYSKSMMKKGIEKELDMLEVALDYKITKLSIHEPARFGSIDKDTDLPSGIEYYCWDSDHYKGKKYISDSGARWREGCMCNHIGKHSSMIILTHPMWWFETYSAENY
jgi:hypothetical protein